MANSSRRISFYCLYSKTVKYIIFLMPTIKYFCRFWLSSFPIIMECLHSTCKDYFIFVLWRHTFNYLNTLMMQNTDVLFKYIFQCCLQKVQIFECCQFYWNITSNLFRTLTVTTAKSNLSVGRNVHHKAISKTW